MAGFGHQGEVLRATFSHSRFGAVGAVRVGVFGDEGEHLVIEVFTCSASRGVDSVCEVSHGVECAFVAELAQFHVVPLGAFLHDAAREVVRDCVHADFFFYHPGAFAAQDVRSHADFDVAEALLDSPSLEVEFGEDFARVFFGVEQGGGQVDVFDSKAGDFHTVAHDSELRVRCRL